MKAKMSLVSMLLILSILACNLPVGWVEGVADAAERMELFVATTGADSADCQTPATACRSVGRAVAVAAASVELPMAVINIAPGTYDEASDLLIQKSMTFRGAGGTVINRASGGGGIPTVFSIFVPATGFVRIEQVELRSIHYGMVVSRGNVELSGVTFRSIASHGLAIFPEPADARITVGIDDGVFTGILGNPIITRSPSVTINLRGVTISDNQSTAIINYGSVLNLTGVSITNNRAAPSYPSAILNGNGSDLGAGAVGVARIANSAIYGNSNPGAGPDVSAIFNAGGLLEISNSTLSGNDGSGISLGTGSETVLTHVTIVNHAGNGIDGLDLPSLRLSLRNSLVVYNGRDCDLRTTYSGLPPERTAIENSIDSDNTCREPLSVERAAWDFNPGVDGALRDNGGATMTHALLPESPALDVATCTVTSDQRGVARPQGSNCDVGAFELEFIAGAPTPTPLAVVQDATPDATLHSVPTQIQISPTPVSFVRFATGANCRSGPGIVYPVITAFQKGAEVPAKGRSNDNTWWLLNANGVRCWVSASVVDAVGLLTGLPVVPAPPTPVLTSTPEPTPTKNQSPPGAPLQLYIDGRVCTGQAYSLILRWMDGSDSEQGFRVYRNGSLIATLGPNETKFADAPPFGGPYTYAVEAFSAAGASARPAVQEAGCIP
jgi:hypothetical protein